MMMGDALRDALDPASRGSGDGANERTAAVVDGLRSEVRRPTSPRSRGVDLTVLRRADRRGRRANPDRVSRRRRCDARPAARRADESPAAASLSTDGHHRAADRAHAARSIRGTGIGYVPQDPMTNLNPVWKVGFQIREALRANDVDRPRRRPRRGRCSCSTEVGMHGSGNAGRHRYPHQLSGGMCQRALIAIGLAGRPRLLIADEPTSALDVTVQRQVLDHLQATDRPSSAPRVLLITHDLALAAERAEQIVVMYRGSRGGIRCGTIDPERSAARVHPAAGGRGAVAGGAAAPQAGSAASHRRRRSRGRIRR